MHLACHVEFDSPTTNVLLLADCHSYMDDRSTIKASHLEQPPLWKTRDIEMSLWKTRRPLAIMATTIHTHASTCYRCGVTPDR